MSRLEEIRARCEAATQGEWEYIPGESESLASYYTHPVAGGIGTMTREFPVITVGEATPEETGGDESFYYVDILESDAEFISHSRQDIPWLIAEIERLTDERDRYKAERDAMERAINGKCEFCGARGNFCGMKCNDKDLWRFDYARFSAG